MRRQQDQVLPCFVQLLIRHIVFKQFRVQKKGIINAVVKGLLFPLIILGDHMDAADISVHTLNILQKQPHIPLSVLLQGIRIIPFPV